jgi:hypothetical protein
VGILGLVGHAVTPQGGILVKSLIIFFFAALLCEGQQTAAAVGERISGTVQGDDGSALVGASIFLRRIRPPGSPQREKIDWASTTTAGGAFSFDLLPYGQYTICVQVPSGNWLNPCEWGNAPPVVTASAAQRPLPTTIVLKRGAVVTIRVGDPGQLLAQDEGKEPGTHLLLGVRSDALIFHTASVTAQDAAGRNYAVTIPFDRSVNLVVASSFFQLASASGAAVAASGAATIPIAVPSGQAPPALNLNVTGHR